MAKKITQKEVVQTDLWQNTIDSTEALIKLVDELTKSLEGVAKVARKSLDTKGKSDFEGLKGASDNIDKINTAYNQKITIDKQRVKLEERLSIAQSEQGKENEKIRVRLQRQNKLNKEAAQTNLKLVGSYIRLKKQTNEAAIKVRDLTIEYGKNSKQTKLAEKAYRNLSKQLKQANESTKSSIGLVSRLKDGLKSGLGFIGIAAGVAAISRAVGNATETISDFDESVANLAKTTQLAVENARELAEEIIKIDTKTSITALLELATAGGRLGLVGQELIDFTEQTDKAFVALGDSLGGTAEEIGLSLGKIASNFGIEERFGIGEAINKIGSSLNELGANSKATEGPILDFTNRLTGVGVQAGISAQDIQALGAFFDETGQSMEVAATTINKLLPAIGKDTARFAKIAGQDIEEFSKLAGERPLEALKAVAIGAKSSASGLQGLSKVLKNYGIESSRAAGIVGVLSEKTDRLTELQFISNEAFEEATSLSDEFAIKNDTLAAKLAKTGKRYDRLILSIENGSGTLSDAFKSVIEGVDIFIQSLIDANRSYSEIVKNVRNNNLSDRVSEDVEEFQKFLKATNQVNQSTEELRKTALRFLNVDIARVNELKKLRKAQGEFTESQRRQFIIVGSRITNILNSIKAQEKLNEVEEISITNGDKKIKQLNGLIEIQTKVVNDLNKKIIEAKKEDDILNLKVRVDVAVTELNRLKRIVSSTFEEIDKIERGLIEDSSERRIAEEIAKSEKIITQIKSNSQIEASLKEELILKENKRLAKFVNDEEIKAGKKRIKAQSEISKSEFEIKRTGFKTQEDFEKEKAKQFKAIQKKALEDELKLLEQFGGENTEVREAQIKAQLEGLDKLGSEVIKNRVDTIAVLEALNDKYFNDKIAQADQEIDDTKSREQELQTLAAQGNADAAASLGQNQKDQAEANRKKEELLQKEKQFELALAVISAFNSELDSGKSTPEALASAISSTSVLTSFISSLPAFFGGTENVGESLGAPQVSGKDGYVIRADGDERIVDGTNNAKMGGISNDLAANVISDFNNDLLTYNTPSLPIQVQRFDTGEKLIQRLDTLEKSLVTAINEKEAYLGSDVDTIKKLFIRTYKKGSTRTNLISKGVRVD